MNERENELFEDGVRANELTLEEMEKKTKMSKGDLQRQEVGEEFTCSVCKGWFTKINDNEWRKK